jgi:hypothetical protein
MLHVCGLCILHPQPSTLKNHLHSDGHKKALAELYEFPTKSLPPTGGQQKIDQFCVATPAETPWSSAKANRLLSLWIATSGLPLSLCESPHARAFLSYISGGGYCGVTHLIVSNTLREIELKDVMPGLKALLGSLDSISCTTDFWTDIHRRPMCGVTGHFITHNRQMGSQLLAMSPFEGTVFDTGF